MTNVSFLSFKLYCGISNRVRVSKYWKNRSTCPKIHFILYVCDFQRKCNLNKNMLHVYEDYLSKGCDASYLVHIYRLFILVINQLDAQNFVLQ